MKIALGADHAGYAAKESLKAWLASKGHEVQDFGTHSAESTDYPDYALAVSTSVKQGQSDRGVLVCGTGIGMSMAANKVCGIRAAVCHDRFTAEAARKHNHANVLCMGARVLSEQQRLEVLDTFLSTGEEGERHARRVSKVMRIEQPCRQSPA